MLHQLLKLTSRANKRVGRGVGSGKGGHTAGRGSKGHTSREGGTIPLWFEGGQLPLIKRLPYARGKFHFKSLNKRSVPIKVEQLAFVKDGIVTIETLVASGLVKSIQTPVKIVAGGMANVKEIHGIAVTKAAKEVLEKAGTTIHIQ